MRKNFKDVLKVFFGASSSPVRVNDVERRDRGRATEGGKMVLGGVGVERAREREKGGLRTERSLARRRNEFVLFERKKKIRAKKIFARGFTMYTQ
jgi:hypothetical protein